MSDDPTLRLAKEIVALTFGSEPGVVERGADIIRAKLAEALPDLIEPPRRFNWARQNYCSGWNQCVHAMRKRLAIDAARKQDAE